jgi:hypothetical protein
MQSPSSHEEDTNHRIERLPQSAERANGQKSLAAALDVCRGVHRANPTISPSVNDNYLEAGATEEGIKRLEASALFEWALKADMLLDAEEFTSLWVLDGCIEGGEHQVFIHKGTAYKRNNLAFHVNYLEYFERLIVHNWLFPDTLYWFEGLMLVIENDDEPPQLRPVVSQLALRAVRGATRDEVAVEMARLGFERRYEDNYVNTDRTLFIDCPPPLWRNQLMLEFRPLFVHAARGLVLQG